ncbi:MAG: hypothetical protein PX640_21130 [Microcystis sp. M49629_WE12]|uniref:hypothetical protein n=1 Tax=Microcystis sp. M53602_WE12 TaxID=3030674 RepID=UPI00258CCFA4|nr:hypothetical protein [Microcystis sp. M53602_WE12]MDJ0566394.1 hypothetical protein [Microcystis sp. M49629_WE12]MDJ0604130.1 hypothetical protein [Microcystis sp. M53602_WE12]
MNGQKDKETTNNLYEGRGQKAKGKRQEAKGSFVLPTPHTPHPLLITENSLVCVLPIW